MPENSFIGSTNRLKEMMGILRRHQVTKGLTPEKLRLIFEDLGPTYVKFGQIMSMRTDMLPQEYCRELSKLRAEVRPMSREETEAALRSEYGRSPDGIFFSFDWEPLGSASIAQVHRARLKTGERVVVKVERPGIYETMARDVSLLRRVSGLLKIVSGMGDSIDFNMVINEMWTSAQQEMDFLNEANQAEEFRRLNSGVSYIAVPRVYRAYSTSKVLVMEDMEGIPIDDTAALEAQGYDLREIGTKLAENYVKQMVDDGFFHADPHPGNLRIRDGKIVWLDMGMMGRLIARDQKLLSRALRAAVTSDVNEVKEILLAMGKPGGPIDHARLYADLDEMLGKYGTYDIGSMNMMEVMDDLTTLATRHRLVLPPGFSMLGRGLVTLEGVVSKLSPEINIFQIIGAHLSGSFFRDFDGSGDLKKGLYSAYSSGRKILGLPAQLSELLKVGIKGQTKVNVDVTDAQQLIRALGKLVNRVVLSIVEAGLLITAAILGASDLPKLFLGIPVWSAVFFLLSLLLGAVIAWDMFRNRK